MIYLRLEICSDEIKLCYAYITAQEMKFCIKDSLSKCDQILKGKLHFLYYAYILQIFKYYKKIAA